ncbi:MAG: DNA repair protein RecO, partial [Patescibacteria group bacterium]|nr:DNA repair protein RecO [Patescibacteria group bacterium]
ESRDLQLVTQADLVSNFTNIKSDLEKLKYASSIIELVLKLTLEDDPHKRLFSGMERILERLDGEQTEPMLLFIMFYKFFLEEIGYGIVAENCSECNAALSLSEEVLYNYEFGFLCKSCGKDHLINYKFSSELFNKIICLSQRNKNCSYDKMELENIIVFFEKFLIYHIDEYNGLKSLQMY